MPIAIILKNATSECATPVTPPDATKYSYTATAKSAPMGSITMPSQRRTLLMFLFGRMVLSIGIITVGPVTTTSEPNKSAIDGSNPNSLWATNEVLNHVNTAPTDTKRRTMASKPLNSENRRVKLPSNRIMATLRETTGKSRLPSSSFGSNISPTGPRSTPASRSNRIAGRRIRHAAH